MTNDVSDDYDDYEDNDHDKVDYLKGCSIVVFY